METEISILWGKGDFHKVTPELDSYIFLFFFQGSKDGGGKVGGITVEVLVRRGSRREEDSLGDDLFAKVEGWLGGLGFEEV